MRVITRGAVAMRIMMMMVVVRRMRMIVMAVAVMADGKVLFAQKEIKVTLGGCGG